MIAIGYGERGLATTLESDRQVLQLLQLVREELEGSVLEHYLEVPRFEECFGVELEASEMDTGLFEDLELFYAEGELRFCLVVVREVCYPY